MEGLLKKIGIGITLAALTLAGFGISGCGGKLYFPAGKYPNITSVVEQNARIEKLTAPHNESAYIGLPFFVYTTK